MKKKYIAPTMCVYPFVSPPTILAGSFAGSIETQQELELLLDEIDNGDDIG